MCATIALEILWCQMSVHCLLILVLKPLPGVYSTVGLFAGGFLSRIMLYALHRGVQNERISGMLLQAELLPLWEIIYKALHP